MLWNLKQCSVRQDKSLPKLKMVTEGILRKFRTKDIEGPKLH